MPLYERLTGRTDAGPPTALAKIHIHQFAAAMSEWFRKPAGQRGAFQNRIIAFWTLDAGEQAEVTTLVGRVSSGALSGPQIEQTLVLGEIGFYDNAEVRTQLGV